MKNFRLIDCNHYKCPALKIECRALLLSTMEQNREGIISNTYEVTLCGGGKIFKNEEKVKDLKHPRSQ